jgi:hypothetical protein
MCFFSEYFSSISSHESDDLNFIFCSRCYGSPRSSMICTRCNTLTPLFHPDPDLIMYYCDECLRANCQD